jgi:hypothetical protein
MKKTVLDILKAVGMTLGGFLIGSLACEGLKLVANLTGVNPLYLLGGLLFAVVAYANYQLIKLSK